MMTEMDPGMWEGTFWAWLVGSNGITAMLAYFVPAFVTRKKDAGELAGRLLAKAVDRLDRLEKEADACHQVNAALMQRCERNEFLCDLLLAEIEAGAVGSPLLDQARSLLRRVPRGGIDLDRQRAD